MTGIIIHNIFQIFTSTMSDEKKKRDGGGMMKFEKQKKCVTKKKDEEKAAKKKKKDRLRYLEKKEVLTKSENKLELSCAKLR